MGITPAASSIPASEPAASLFPGHVPALDGLRGLAILGVLIVHSRPETAASVAGQIWIQAAEAGAYGVDLFFVLSGFLITGVLLESRHSPGYFKNFYARRILRLFPVYYGYLLVAAFVFPALHHLVQVKIPDYPGPWWWYATYLSNWKAGQGAGDALLGHFWSLAVEEQFYLFWPVAVYFLNRRRLGWFCVAIAAGAFLLRCHYSMLGAQANLSYRLTPMRLDTLALGALMAIGFRTPRAIPTMRRWAWPVCAACLATFVTLGYLVGGVEWHRPSIQTWGSLLLSIGFAGLVVAVALSKGGSLHLLTMHPVLRSLGKYSYAMYVYHIAIYTHTAWLMAYLSRRSPEATPAAWSMLYPFFAIPVTFLAAQLSWILMERRVLALKSRFPTPSGHPGR